MKKSEHDYFSRITEINEIEFQIIPDEQNNGKYRNKESHINIFGYREQIHLENTVKISQHNQ
jgi:hypothetical protein